MGGRRKMETKERKEQSLVPPAQAQAPSANIASASASDGLSFLEPFLALHLQAEPRSLSQIAVEKANALGIEVFAELLETSGADLQAKPTYPTVLPNGRKFKVLERSKMGHQPFVAVSPSLSGIGFFQQRNEACEELRKCREVNNQSVDCGLAALMGENQPPMQDAPGCTKCDVLTVVVVGMKEESKRTAKKVEALQEKLNKLEEDSKQIAEKHTKLEESLTKQISSLLNMVEDLRKVHRRNVIEKARKKGVLDVGKSLEDVESWKNFFTENEQAVLGLGISGQFLSLLRKGKKVLHKVVYDAPQADMVDAILSLKEGSSERKQYEEAFKFAFDVDIHGFLSANHDDDDE